MRADHSFTVLPVPVALGPISADRRSDLKARGSACHCAVQYVLFFLREVRSIQADAGIIVAIFSDDRLELFLDMFFTVAIEQVAKQSAIKIAGFHEPVCYWES